MNRIISIICFVVLTLLSARLMGHDFSARTPSNHMLYYTITSSTAPYTVKVVQNPNPQSYSGNLIIPDTVSFNGITYSVVEIDTMAFSNEIFSQVTLPRTLTRLPGYPYKAFPDCRSLVDIIVDTANPRFMSYDGVLYTRAMDTIVEFPRGRRVSHFEMPNSLTNISYGLFYYDQYLDYVVIPNFVRTIDEYAYARTNIKSLILGVSVDTIRELSFIQTDLLADITFLSSTPPWISDEAFFSYNGVTPKTLHVPCGSGKDYEDSNVWPMAFTIVQDCNDYAVTVDSSIDGSAVTVSTNTAMLGDTVIINVAPNQVYNIVDLAVVKTSDPSFIVASNIDTFVMPNFDVMVTAMFSGNNALLDVESTNVNIFSRNGEVVIENAGVRNVAIVDVMGRILFNGKVGDRKVVKVPNRGMYFVRVGNQHTVKVPVVR